MTVSGVDTAYVSRGVRAHVQSVNTELRQMEMQATQYQRHHAPSEANYKTDEKEILPAHKLKPPDARAARHPSFARHYPVEALARAALPVRGFREFARAGARTDASQSAAQRSTGRQPA